MAMPHALSRPESGEVQATRVLDKQVVTSLSSDDQTEAILTSPKDAGESVARSKAGQEILFVWKLT